MSKDQTHLTAHGDETAVPIPRDRWPAGACYHSWVPSGDESRLDLELVRSAVDGDRAAARSIVIRLAPVIQKSVSRIWIGSQRDPARRRHELQDLVQDTFVALFANGARELLRWDPARGMKLESFISLVTRRLVLSKLRSRRREAAELGPSVAPETAAPESSADEVFAAREGLHLLGERLRAALSPLGLEMFHRMFVLEQSVEAICRESPMTADAVYQWRKRLRDTLQELRERSTPPAGNATIGSSRKGVS